MKIKAETDLYISTTWGAAISLKAGETREVGDDLGYAALQQGAVEDKGEAIPAPAPKKRGRPKKIVAEVEVTQEETDKVALKNM